ncbi:MULTISPECIES: hemolysin [unclassified Micromonospora]|uniref:calcium-binding protein n=1 Tax=unclassified Micromonospora TaxID=2617518 RepID=UPI00188EE59F|nr:MULTISPECIES: hemolysin [unclassified Micromonospora]MBF5031870.1 hemolysin [Micromonospora sp. ANENR4]WBC05783.1 hemolysin [Micromonospora sp. WMMA1976]
MSHRYLSTARTAASVAGALVLAAAGLAGGATPASAAYIVPPDCGPYSGFPVPAGYTRMDAVGVYVSTSSNNREFIIGTPAREVIVGSVYDDIICGLAGNDDIKANTGDDIVYGGFHGDDIWGDLGNDNLHGDGGADTIHGDRFIGPSALDGNDRVDGGSNDDYLFGDKGVDTLVGGPGWDEGDCGPDAVIDDPRPTLDLPLNCP